MIELYTFRTPNGKKASVMLEEVGLAYNVHVVRVGDTQKPEYAAISKIRRIPTIVDSEGPGGRPVTIFESGAIMIYLAQKTGSSLYPNDPMKRLEVDQWLFHGQSSFGMLLSQTSLFESEPVSR